MNLTNLIAIALTIFIIGLISLQPASTTTARSSMSIPPSRPLSLVSSTGVRSTIAVEMATTGQSQGIGLSGRLTLAENSGMLFVFDHDDKWTFWMRDTPIPLSIAFIGADGTIVDIQDMEPLTDTRHSPSQKVRMALEMNRGHFAKNGIVVGDLAILWPGRLHLSIIAR